MNGYYWIYIGMLAFLVGWELAGTAQRRRALYYGACFFLILIFALQDFGVSVDIAEYMRQYDLIQQLTFGQMLVHKFEIGYVLLCRGLAFLFASERVLLVVMGVLILLPYAISFETETKAPMVALMAFLALGMYVHALIYWRQLAAMAILTASYRYIRQRRLLPFLAVVLVAMTFHKTAIVFLWLYLIYHVKVNGKLLGLCAVAAVVLGLLGRPIIELGIAYIYPRYTNFTRETEGGETLLAVLWVVTLLSYWVFRDRMDEDSIRLPFLMILTAATIQPICLAFYNWLRIVLYFRVALVPMTAQLYVALFRQREGNPVLALLGRRAPRLQAAVAGWYDKRWFRLTTELVMFAVLFVWYLSELDGGVYRMVPVRP